MASVAESFRPNVLNDSFIQEKHKAYDESAPYHHAVVDGLINDDLLRAARNEILEELHFTEKETDIYKVNQTGDLANLDGLPEEEAKRLKAVLQVRNAIYSEEFRSWIQKVTGCGPLSAKKKDMSINDYRHGCHLLNHDDVISTRRVSYILYLPDPDQEWKPEWGGALELYPVKRAHVPEDTPSLMIPPRWNQYTLFAVQPGHSFHSVEEVVHPSNGRLSISGWFHRPQPGEPGFSQEEEDREVAAEKEFSSVANITSEKWLLPFEEYVNSDPPLPGSSIPSEHLRFLAHFLNPAYLTSKIQATLFEKFGDDSHLLLSEFLRQDIAEALEKSLRKKDEDDGLVWWSEADNQAVGFDSVRIQPHAVGTAQAKEPSEEDKRWTLAGPPHRERFAMLERTVTPGSASAVDYASTESPMPPLSSSASDLLHCLTHVLFPSVAFRHFIANITQLIPLAGRPIRARRFRPGLDYTLARSDEEAVLDLTLTLTPDVVGSAKKVVRQTGKPKGLAGKRAKTPASLTKGVLSKADVGKLDAMWETGDIGGWECYLAPHEGEEDPAVYQSASSRRQREAKDDEKAPEADEGDADEDAEGEDPEGEDDDEMDVDDEDDDFDGVLLNVTPSYNTLLIVLRDEGVMRFVKYLSACAGGSRWDISAEFTAGTAEIEEEQEA